MRKGARKKEPSCTRDVEPEKKVYFALKKAGILRPVMTKVNDTELMAITGSLERILSKSCAY